MQGVFIVAFCVIGQIYAETTVHPTHQHHHHTHEANEIDPALFYYDASSHYMAMKLGNNCYLEKFPVNHRPGDLHTEDGLLAVETRMMFLVSKGTHTAMSHDQVNHLSQHLEHMCAGASVYTVTPKHHHHTTTMGPQ